MVAHALLPFYLHISSLSLRRRLPLLLLSISAAILKVVSPSADEPGAKVGLPRELLSVPQRHSVSAAILEVVKLTAGEPGAKVGLPRALLSVPQCP